MVDLLIRTSASVLPTLSGDRRCCKVLALADPMLQVVGEADPQHVHLHLRLAPHMELPQPQLALDPRVTRLYGSSLATVSLLGFFTGHAPAKRDHPSALWSGALRQKGVKRSRCPCVSHREMGYRSQAMASPTTINLANVMSTNFARPLAERLVQQLSATETSNAKMSIAPKWLRCTALSTVQLLLQDAISYASSTLSRFTIPAVAMNRVP